MVKELVLAAAFEVIGPLFIAGGTEAGEPRLILAGSLTVMVGTVLLLSAVRPWYCETCGERVGHGGQPDRCPGCGSDRLANSKPGADPGETGTRR